MSRTVAHFRRGPVVRNALGLASVIVLLVAAVSYTPDGRIVEHILSPGPLMYPVGLFAAIICSFTLYLCILAVIRIIFQEGKGLWIAGGKIIYMSRLLLSVRLEDVDEIRLGTYGRYKRPGIVLRLRSGRQKIIPSLPLIEPSDVVIARLKEVLPN
jgi:hypothetical protein